VNLSPEKLIHQRKLKHMTQEDLAHKAGMTNTAIARLESGRIKHPRLDTLGKLAKALKCGLWDLI
jgi:transcriptional regulator with XRE-family HTH domain